VKNHKRWAVRIPKSARAEGRNKARRTAPLAILGLGAIIFGFVCLTEFFVTLAKPARPQAGGCGPEFTVVDVATAGTGAMQGSGGTGINANGDIVGVYITAPSASVPNLAHGFVRIASTGTITPFDAPNAGTGKNQGTFAVSINDGGEITGIYSDSVTAEHGFLRAANGTFTEFDVPGSPVNVTHRGTSPTDINASGVITGMMEDINTVRHGFVRAADGTFTSFDAPGAGGGLTEGTIPLRINAGGDVVGFYVDVNHVSHGFVRMSAGTFIAPIDAPGAGTTGSQKGFKFGGTIAVGIDTAGDVAGIYADTNSIFHGYVRAANGTITPFDVPGTGTTGLFPGTAPTSMNAAGDIAGIYTDASGSVHGFVRNFSTGTITAPLDAPNAGTSGMVNGTVPFGINASDDLAGFYIDASVVFHGFSLSLSSTTAAPTFNPAPGTYGTAQSVTISDVTPGAAIYYTANGTTPTTSSTLYTGPIVVNATTTIEAIAVANGCASSLPIQALYTIESPVATPTIAPASGTYTSVQSVTISDTTAGATIYYTTNNTAPTTASTVYTGPIAVNSSETIQAMAAALGFSNSAVATATYVVNLPAAATPTFSPAAGTYTSVQTVTLSDTTAAATIYYTTNGTTPTTGSTKYSGPISVGSTETINAIAVATGFANSLVATAAYIINLPAAAMPMFSPAAGTYTSVQSVTISDTTAGATIYYTTNNTAPTTASTVYTGPIAVNSTETIQAMAAAPGFSNSAVASATYTLNLPTPDFKVVVSPTTLTIVAGQSGTATFTVTPVNGFNSQVSFACTGLPAEAACTFSPSSVTPNGIAAASSTLTVTTTAKSAELRPPAELSQRPMYAILLPVLAVLFGFSARKGRSRRGLRLLGVLIFLAAVSGLTSCNSGTPVGNPGTPIGTSNVSVSAATSGAGGTNHAATLTITITQ
jgi:ribosome-binding factor A